MITQDRVLFLTNYLTYIPQFFKCYSNSLPKNDQKGKVPFHGTKIKRNQAKKLVPLKSKRRHVFHELAQDQVWQEIGHD